MKDRIFIKVRDYYELILIKDIIYIEAAGPNTMLYTVNRRLTTSCNLQVLLTKINRAEIVRIHRSYAVNLNWIIALNLRSLRIKGALKKNVPLPISKKYQKSVQSKVTVI